jgi:hypothetical protein
VLTGTHSVASGRIEELTTAAVHDALCGSTAMTTRSDTTSLLDPKPLINTDNG